MTRFLDFNSMFQFKDIDWDDIAVKRVEPPWLPLVHHNGDPSNYEEYEPEEPIAPDEIYEEAFLRVSAVQVKLTLTLTLRKGSARSLIHVMDSKYRIADSLFNKNSLYSSSFIQQQHIY